MCSYPRDHQKRSHPCGLRSFILFASRQNESSLSPHRFQKRGFKKKKCPAGSRSSFKHRSYSVSRLEAAFVCSCGTRERIYTTRRCQLSPKKVFFWLPDDPLQKSREGPRGLLPASLTGARYSKLIL